MWRFLAFDSFAAAAFGWTPPGLDRAGLVALGLAFLSLTVGRSREGLRPSLPRSTLVLPPRSDLGEAMDASDLRARIQAYGKP